MTTLALRNNQLACVMTAAATLPVKARDAFLKHLADQLPDGFTDAELDSAVRAALAAIRETA
jgi:hypothetical protein